VVHSVRCRQSDDTNGLIVLRRERESCSKQKAQVEDAAGAPGKEQIETDAARVVPLLAPSDFPRGSIPKSLRPVDQQVDGPDGSPTGARELEPGGDLLSHRKTPYYHRR
jgi:hypothetical protein